MDGFGYSTVCKGRWLRWPIVLGRKASILFVGRVRIEVNVAGSVKYSCSDARKSGTPDSGCPPGDSRRIPEIVM